MKLKRHSILLLFEEWKYPLLLVMLLAGIVFSKWLLSATQMLLFICIVSEKDGFKRILKSFSNPIVLALISIYIFHIVGLLWTEDLKYAFKDLKIKLPLLSFPVLFAAIPDNVKEKSILLLKTFVYFVTAMSLINIIRHLTIPITDDFQAALWHSHIRFSLIICLSIFVNFWIILKKKVSKKETIILYFCLALLTAFLFILKSLTGIIIFIMLLFYIIAQKEIIRKVKISILAISIIIISIFVYEIAKVKKDFFPPTNISELNHLETKTLSGNPYEHDTNCFLSENGNLLFTHISRKELIQEWNKRSDEKILTDSMPETYYALIRYLASIGEHKDSCGMSKLTDTDIANIENKITSRKYAKLNPIEKRIYKLFWEITSYQKSGNPSGHSLTQRFEFWKTAIKIIEERPIIGVGTGDVQNSFNEMYDRTNSPLDKKHRLRSHNQYLAITVGLGFIGLAIFMFSLLYPILKQKQNQNFLYIGYIFIFLLSMLNEDTLETQIGVTFYTLFNCMFLFIINKKIGDLHYEK